MTQLSLAQSVRKHRTKSQRDDKIKRRKESLLIQQFDAKEAQEEPKLLNEASCLQNDDQ